MASTSNIDPTHLLRAFAEQGYIGTSGTVTMAGTSETPLLLLTNSIANTLNLATFLRKFGALTAGHQAQFNIYLNPTVTGAGTAAPATSLFYDSSAPSAQGVLTFSPTVSGNGTLLDTIVANGMAVLDNSPLIIAPGNSLLVTCLAQVASDKVFAGMSWFEQ